MSTPTKKLRLGPLPSSTSTKLTFTCPASLKANLDLYAALHAQAYGESLDAATLIPHMLEAFMAGDPGFKNRDASKPSQKPPQREATPPLAESQPSTLERAASELRVRMNVNPKEIKICLDIATSKKAAYLTNHHKPYAAWISVNALLEMTRTSHGIIELSFLVDDVDHYIYSFIATTNDGRYEICIVPGKGMTNCWKRFALCKELFHVMLDSESSRCIVLKDHLQDFTASMLGLDVDANESSRNEVMAEFAALEFLFPYVKRLDSIKAVAIAQNAKEAYIEIAEKFKTQDYLLKSI